MFLFPRRSPLRLDAEKGPAIMPRNPWEKEAPVTKSDLAVKIARETGLRQQDIREIVQKTLDGIRDALVAEGRIELRDFGVFQVRTRKARKARNPRTGEPVFVPEKKVVSFRAGKQMLDEISATSEKEPGADSVTP